MPLSLMVDIETLATTDDAAIVAIGTVIFDANSIVDTQELLIDPKWAPGHRSIQTYLDFWMDRQKVPEKVFNRMLGGTLKPWDAALSWSSFVAKYNIELAFAYPPQFDFVILRSFFRMLRMDTNYPLHYKKERDCRTLFKLAQISGVNISPAYEGVEEHNALSDAIAQAKAVQICNRELF